MTLQSLETLWIFQSTESDRLNLDLGHGSFCGMPDDARVLLECLVAGDPKILQKLLPRLLAAILLFSIIVASLMSATHQAEFVLHTPGSTHELTAQDSGKSGVAGDILPSDTIICAAGFLCHAPLALIGNSDRTDPSHLAVDMVRLSPGLSLDGRTTDVITPPPLLTSA
ncbi:MAG: hypothetical protein HUJ27_12495 [Rhodobacteraceae bacterium]|nr:hypothetical protein [Paracoccaceae bacterium]